MRKKYSILIVILILSLLAAACNGNPTNGTDGLIPEGDLLTIRVSPEGDDAANGVSAPVKTVSRALALAGEKIGSANVTIELADGTYPITEPLNITHTQTSREEGYILTLKGSANSVISGGVSVSGWKKHEGNIWKATLSGVDSVNGFYVDGKNMTLARQEVSGSFVDATGKGGIVLETRDTYTNFRDYNTFARIVKCAYTVKSSKSWKLDDLKKDLPNIKMYFDQTFSRTSFSFTDVTQRGSSYTFTADQETLNTLNGAKMADYNINANRYYLANSYLFLDKEGEYYFDTATKTLYFFSASSPEGKDCVVPVSNGLLNIQGINTKLASNIRIQDLTFAYGTSDMLMKYSFKEIQSDAYVIGHTEGDATYERLPLPAQITLDRASNVTFDNCKFLNMDTSGIALREHVYNVSITDSDIKNINGSGIAVGTFSLKDGYGIGDRNPHPEDLLKVYSVKKNSVVPAQLTIRNNVIENCGIDSPSSNGILVYYAYNAQITNNTVSTVGGSGISLGWGWGNWTIKKNATQNCGNILVEANKILAPCTQIDDAGAIYTLGAFFGDGCVIKNNYIDMKGSAADDIPTIYLDEGSEWVTATGNVSVNTRMWLHCRALPLVTKGGKVSAGSPEGNTIMNSSITGNYSDVATKQLGYGGSPWPYASEVKGANVTISGNKADAGWKNNDTIMAIVNAAGATR